MPATPPAATQVQQRNGGILRLFAQDLLAADGSRAYLPCQRDQNARQAGRRKRLKKSLTNTGPIRFT
jgi:hypothetical protein